MTGASDWTGRVGRTWASEWERTDRAFAGLTPFLDAAIQAATPAGAFRAVDIGCGAGSTAIALAKARPEAAVTGVDLSIDLIAAARERVEAPGNLDFRVGDVTAVVGELAPVDLFVSRHGVMFFTDPVAALVRLRAAAARGARFVFSCFCDPADNPWAGTLVEEVIGVAPQRAPGYSPGPFGFADPDRTAMLLTDAGWSIETRARVDFRYVVGDGADPVGDAVDFLRRIGPLAGALRDVSDRNAAIDRLKTVLARYRTEGTVASPAAAWIWRVNAMGEGS